MDLGLNNKVVIVTGGSKGIGLACARAFLDEGAKVAIVSRAAANLDAARKQLGGVVHTAVANLSDAQAAIDAVTAIKNVLGPIDVLINSAGAARRYAPDELNAAAWRDAMNAKFFSYVYAMDAVIKDMAQRGTGAIVNIIGTGGKVAGNFHIAGGSANAALMLASTGLAAAYASQGVRINAINPGTTVTGRVSEGLKVEARALNTTEDEVMRRMQARIPMGRFAAPEEIARVAVFLSSSQASYVNGAIVPMDGVANPVI